MTACSCILSSKNMESYYSYTDVGVPVGVAQVKVFVHPRNKLISLHIILLV